MSSVRVRRWLVVLGFVATAAIGLACGSSGDRESTPIDTLNCDDFQNRDQAQRAYEQARTTAQSDPHRLDDDGDGRACEGEIPGMERAPND